jgi:hypothetical protein
MCQILVLLVAALAAGGCGKDGAPGTVGGVTAQVIDAKAVNGGCGDSNPSYGPDGGAIPCGPDTEFSVTVSLTNTSDRPATIAPGKATLMTVDGGSELSQGTLELRSDSSFDGTLAPGASITVVFDYVRNTYEDGGYYDVYYTVSLSVNGKTLTVKSPPTVFRPLPA